MANTTRRTAPPDSDLPASVADLRGQAKRRFPSVAGAASQAGFELRAQVCEDPSCGGRTVWLAQMAS
jgi:hypothetical protein